MKLTSQFASVAIFLLANGTLSATQLYNLDFSAPEVGSYQTVFGSPSVQSSVGPFSSALMFHAVTTYDQIRLPIEIAAPRYEIQYDVLVHNVVNSQYSFNILLDTPEVRTLDFHGGLNTIYVFQPYGSATLATLSNDRVYHVGISVNLPANLWTVSLDGVQEFASPINASSLQAIRFNMSPWIGGAGNAPGTYAALDNVTIEAVPEPGSGALASMGLLVWLLSVYSRSQKNGFV